jgi:uncharacterized protein YkwD
MIAAMAMLALVATATAGEACSRSIPAKAERTLVPSERIDQDLLDAAVRAEVNFHRCRAGLPALSEAGNGLARMAKTHSTWMASTGTLSHRNTIPGKASLSQRVKASGEKFRTGAENIGMVHRYQIDNLRFRIIDSKSCEFATYDGQRLPPHSYASLARHAVNLWMNSPGHRKNILNRQVNRISTAVAFDPKAPYCGQFWLTQNFIG